MIWIILSIIYVLSVIAMRYIYRLAVIHNCWRKGAATVSPIWFIPFVNTIGSIMFAIILIGELEPNILSLIKNKFLIKAFNLDL